VSEGERER
jgi:hypothetical protein